MPTVLPGPKFTVGVPAIAMPGVPARLTGGMLSTFTDGVPLIPTLQGPLCVAFTLPVTPTLHGPLWAAPTVPCTGSGVFVTITGAEPAAPTGLLGTSDSASVTIPKLKVINISLLYCFMSVLLLFCEISGANHDSLRRDRVPT